MTEEAQAEGAKSTRAQRTMIDEEFDLTNESHHKTRPFAPGILRARVLHRSYVAQHLARLSRNGRVLGAVGHGQI